MIETRFGVVERCLQVEDRFAVLDGNDTAGGEAPTVANAVDLVEDGNRRITGPEEVGVQ